MEVIIDGVKVNVTSLQIDIVKELYMPGVEVDTRVRDLRLCEVKDNLTKLHKNLNNWKKCYLINYKEEWDSSAYNKVTLELLVTK